MQQANTNVIQFIILGHSLLQHNYEHKSQMELKTLWNTALVIPGLDNTDLECESNMNELGRMCEIGRKQIYFTVTINEMKTSVL